MAKANKHLLPANLGSHSAYYMKGCDHLVIRTKGGPSKAMFKTSPRFANVRKNNDEFGAAGMAAGKIVRAMYAIKHLSDPHIAGRLTSIATIIKKLDTVNILGQRTIAFSKYPHVLEGFDLNRELAFDTVVKNGIATSISREDLTATVILPDLIPRANFNIPWNYPLYRIILVFGVIPDIRNGRQGYGPANSQTKYFPVQEQTEWTAAYDVRKSEEIVLQLPRESNFDETSSLILSIGIEAGKYVTNTIIEPVKDVGCGKICSHF